MATINFNAEEVTPSVAYQALPAGKYSVVIVDSDTKANRRGDGEYLQLEFEVVGGDYSGRKLWSRLNISNPNADAVRMAYGDLSAICHAVGVLHPTDSIELHNLPLVVSVRCRKTPDGDIVNDIRGYEAVPKTAPVAPVNPVTPAASVSDSPNQAGNNTDTAPWAMR